MYLPSEWSTNRDSSCVGWGKFAEWASSSSAAALGFTKSIAVVVMNLVNLCCVEKSDVEQTSLSSLQNLFIGLAPSQSYKTFIGENLLKNNLDHFIILHHFWHYNKTVWLKKDWVNLLQNFFIGLGPGGNSVQKKLVSLITLFCKLHHFIAMEKIFTIGR